jgi:chemotaxis signal transduction protein
MKTIHHLCVAKLAETYIGFDVQSVRSVYEVQDLLTLPLQLPNILGVFNQRGKVLSVVDSNGLCKMGVLDAERSYHTLLHLEYNGDECCFTIDSVEEVKEVDVETLREPPAGLNPAMKRFCSGVLLDKNNRTIMILDFPKMFSALATPTI